MMSIAEMISTVIATVCANVSGRLIENPDAGINRMVDKQWRQLEIDLRHSVEREIERRYDRRNRARVD